MCVVFMMLRFAGGVGILCISLVADTVEDILRTVLRTF